MIFPTHLGMNPHASGDTAAPVMGPGYRSVSSPIIARVYTSQPAPVETAPTVPASSGVASSPAPSGGSASSGSSSGGESSSGGSSVSSSSGVVSAPSMITNVVDPATGLSYSGQLTPDAQTLQNSGALITSTNELTTQGSALAAQGDLITGVPAPTTAQVAAASAAAPATDSFSGFMAWLGEETVWSGVPNGALFAGGAIGLFLLLGSGKKRR
jgi:hypothetical protein